MKPLSAWHHPPTQLDPPTHEQSCWFVSTDVAPLHAAKEEPEPTHSLSLANAVMVGTGRGTCQECQKLLQLCCTSPLSSSFTLPTAFWRRTGRLSSTWPPRSLAPLSDRPGGGDDVEEPTTDPALHRLSSVSKIRSCFALKVGPRDSSRARARARGGSEQRHNGVCVNRTRWSGCRAGRCR